MRLVVIGIALIALGFALLGLAALLTTAKNAAVAGGAVGCVLVFFVPICFGGGAPEAVYIGVAVAAVLMFATAVLQWLLLKKAAG
nr:hypothetical protein [Pyrobaculum arsenaticum]